jgi:N-acyl-D-amino-acid deacylase
MYDTIIKSGNIVDGTGAPAFIADIAIKDGKIVEIGEIKEQAKKIIDAKGALVTPGFVDVHTHYDGQATWDDSFEPSASHGVTTVVMGNCGVGFAPVKPQDHAALIDMMEGVEDIPGTALSVGMPWGEWESFPEYLDLLDSRKYSMDIAAQIPHSALRFYVMGDRANKDQDATPEDIAMMTKLTKEAFDAGAVGFTTSRTIAHRARSGAFIPGTFAAPDELLEIAKTIRECGHGVIEAIMGGTIGKVEKIRQIDEMPLMEQLAEISGKPVTFSVFQQLDDHDQWKELLEYSEKVSREGVDLRPQVIPRAITFFSSLRTYHMFMLKPTYKKLAHLPHDELVAALRRPEIKQEILSEENESVDRRNMDEVLISIFNNTLYVTFPITEPIEYEPKPETSIKEEAKRLGKDPVEHMYDRLLDEDGKALFVLLSSNYVHGNLEVCRDMMLNPRSVTGLGDSGAHVAFISDCSVTTYHLTHWVKNRSRGERLPLEYMVAKMTGVNAELYGFADRGTIEVGKRADINVIDFEALKIGLPELRYDLPNGEPRLLQPATGYVATMVAGVCIRENDTDTGERPGRLIRGAA